MSKVPDGLKHIVKKRARNKCEKCFAKVVRNKSGFSNGSFHHRLPQRLGGLHTIFNVVLLCNTCHKAIHKDEAIFALLGWICWNDPEVIPLFRAQGEKKRGWVLLAPNGDMEFIPGPEGETLCAFTNQLDGDPDSRSQCA